MTSILFSCIGDTHSTWPSSRFASFHLLHWSGLAAAPSFSCARTDTVCDRFRLVAWGDDVSSFHPTSLFFCFGMIIFFTQRHIDRNTLRRAAKSTVAQVLNVELELRVACVRAGVFVALSWLLDLISCLPWRPRVVPPKSRRRPHPHPLQCPLCCLRAG